MRKLLAPADPSPAMIVACLALLVALGGTSVAAVSQLARNSVGTPQLRTGAVTNPKLRNNAVNSAKVANRSLLRSDFAPGQLPAGPVGPQGPAGPAGAAGAAGPGGRHRCHHRADELGTRRSAGRRERRLQQRACHAPRARGTSVRSRVERRGATTPQAVELMTSELEPQLNAQNQVVGFVGGRAERQRRRQHFTVHVALLHAVAALVALFREDDHLS